MLKSEIIAEIVAFYTITGTPFETTSSDEHTPSSVKTYSVLVYETGISEQNRKPVLTQKYVSFIVYDEGGGGEAAYYYQNEPINEVDTDLVGGNTLLAINKIFSSTEMRKRVQAAVAKAAQDVLNEAIPSSLLASNANSGQKNVTVALGSMFWVGKEVLIADSQGSELVTIASINGNVLTMQTDLMNNYTVSRNGYVQYGNDLERRQWAGNVLLDPETYTLSMANLVALDPTIQSVGGLATDINIQTVVNSYITKIAVISYL